MTQQASQPLGPTCEAMCCAWIPTLEVLVDGNSHSCGRWGYHNSGEEAELSLPPGPASLSAEHQCFPSLGCRDL